MSSPPAGAATVAEGPAAVGPDGPAAVGTADRTAVPRGSHRPVVPHGLRCVRMTDEAAAAAAAIDVVAILARHATAAEGGRRHRDHERRAEHERAIEPTLASR